MDHQEPNAVLHVSGLRLRIPTYEGMASILNGVDLTVREKEVVGLVETGSGKTMTALAVTGLIPEDSGLRPPRKARS